ncbi:MAG: hypothetical protein IT374_22505 [Polyangiaceae bacterium]|nr:hypothetical protein [Polyangiaceae bacterium]
MTTRCTSFVRTAPSGCSPSAGQRAPAESPSYDAPGATSSSDSEYDAPSATSSPGSARFAVVPRSSTRESPETVPRCSTVRFVSPAVTSRRTRISRGVKPSVGAKCTRRRPARPATTGATCAASAPPCISGTCTPW